MKSKENVVNEIELKLKKTINKAINKGDFEKALQAIDVYSDISYMWNQKYTDDDIENAIKDIIKKKNYNIYNEDENLDENTVMFYDNFGLDTRGLACIYLKALLKLNYKVIYITNIWSKGTLKEIGKLFENKNESKMIYLEDSTKTKKIENLISIYKEYKPKNAFFYSTPNDVAGTLAFELFTKSTRFQVNLTDHAFWLGKNCFDYCLEFRDYGSSISLHERKIEKEKLIMLPYYPYINYELKFEGFPFDTNGKQIVFSGGALYKTIGEDNYFYKIIDEILKEKEEAVFVYASQPGDDTHLKELEKKYPNRVYHILERKDLYQLISNVDVYINTYPMVGGLMMQYAALSGKPPLTLKTSNDGDGILLKQKDLNIEFDNYKDVAKEAIKLLNDDEYREKRNSEIKKAVITEEFFAESLDNVIKNHTSVYTSSICFDPIDTSAFRQEYINRFDEDYIMNSIAKKSNSKLVLEYFPYFLKKYFKKIFNKLNRKSNTK